MYTILLAAAEQNPSNDFLGGVLQELVLSF